MCGAVSVRRSVYGGLEPVPDREQILPGRDGLLPAGGGWDRRGGTGTSGMGMENGCGIGQGSTQAFQMCPFTRSFVLVLNLALLECCKHFWDK